MIRLSIRHILSTEYIQTRDKGNVQCSETETLISQPSRLVKRIENIMSNAVIEYDEPESEMFTEDMNIFLKECDIDDNIDDINDIGDIEEIENVNPGSSYDENAIAFFCWICGATKYCKKQLRALSQ
ncbi:hypothetical protein RF55_17454 [Lasius niger]|uniref:Uncharacterized protein n=1 Tax=Lasius niger TaxID=67767 RepID=A0A0J7K2G3_LASNI|nr:hypothetical protein RF55_17454 [Lasius niger]